VANSLTIKQLAAISVGSSLPPWHLGQLRRIYNQTPLSLRSLLTKVGAGDAIFYLNIRDLPILRSVTTLDQLKSAWRSSQPSKATIAGLSELLNSVGVRIAFVSEDFRTVGVRGPFESISALQAVKIDSNETVSGISHVAEGSAAAAAGGSAFLIAAGAEEITFLVVGTAAFGVIALGAGLVLIGIGVYEIVDADTTPQPPDIDAGAPSQYGSPPAGVDPSNPPDAGIDVNGLPDQPIIEPPGPTCPPGPPVCPPGPQCARQDHHLQNRHLQVHEGGRMNASSVFKAYRLGNSFDMRIAVAQPNRDWMNCSNNSFANRCLPMRIANQCGWVILNGPAVRAKWFGGATPDAVLIENNGAPPYAAISHFGEGILTFVLPFLFRTPQKTALLFRGPANTPKDSICPLEGLVETEWAVARASVNWKFTRPDTWVEFAPREPICMVVPLQLDLLENARPCIVDIQSDPEMYRQYQTWHKSCSDFGERLRRREPEAVRLGWQRYYFRGAAPHACSEPIAEASEHRTRLTLKEFVDAEIKPAADT
jgi:hypothetical protein